MDAHKQRVAIRAEVVRIVETWADERSVDVRQLLFRLRTAPLPGKLIEAEWFDEQRVVLVTEQAPAVSPLSEAKTGGPHDDDTDRRDPVR